MINIKSGGRTRISGISAAGFLLAFILFASPLIEQIPLAALVGVMFMVVIGTFAWNTFRILRVAPLSATIVMLLVTVVTVLEDLAVAQGDADPFVRLSARISPGDVLSVMGPSGVGKSTLLAAINGTLRPAFRAQGRVRLDGQDLMGVAPQNRGVGILFQDHLLFPHMSVAQNIAFGLAPGLHDRYARVEEALRVTGFNGEGYDTAPLVSRSLSLVQHGETP